jgi:hypothetical protein
MLDTRLLLVLLVLLPSLLRADSKSFFRLDAEILAKPQQSFLLENKNFRCQLLSTTNRLTSCSSAKEFYLDRVWDLAVATFSNGTLVGLEFTINSNNPSASSETFRQVVYFVTTQLGSPLKSTSNVDEKVISEALWRPRELELLKLSLRRSSKGPAFAVQTQLVSSRFPQEAVSADPATRSKN